MKKKSLFILFFCLLSALVLTFASAGRVALAQPLLPIPEINLQIGTTEAPAQLVGMLQLLLLLTVLSLAPAFVILMTSFTRTVIVLSFVRNALATQQIPPNQVIIGLALFLTFFVMSPVMATINEAALTPYLEEEITFEEAVENGGQPLREFMLNNTREKDLALFLEIGRLDRPAGRQAVPFQALVPAFVLSELKTAFQMGFILFVPFLIIDMVVASVLMSMGMFMLPPVIVSLPFKILLFVLVDGWHLVVQSLLESYH
ncbi:MAG: flagellar type III secretion system pore protein FliP [Firmicutes bacterium]|nr:flagellar type III secretion system pore protein FliP [Bacillota bacterium]